MKVAYPAAHQFDKLGHKLLTLKIARHSNCALCDGCSGMHPPPGVGVVLDEQSDSSLGNLEQYGSDDDDEEVSSYLEMCGCGHDAKTHNADDGVVGRTEFVRRGRVAIRLDELLQDSGRLLDFDYTDDDISSLRKQMGHPVSEMTVANTNSSPIQNGHSLPLSPESSSDLSDPPQHPSKRRRVSLSSSLSENDEEEDDEEEDQPLAARVAGGSRSAPNNRTGKQVTGKKSKKSHTAPAPPPAPSGHSPPRHHNGKANGVNGFTRTDDRLDESQLNRLTAGVPVDSVNRMSAPVKKEKISVVELRRGVIQIVPVENDRQPRSSIILTGLKSLFQRQLPMMPREYIARLVYDENSRSLAIIKKGYKIVGGICFRPFVQRGFAEIVFFATNAHDQIKGYGSMLMDHFKVHIRNTYPDMMHFLTYADNYAVGYFEKQGFSKEISLDRSVWASYIKDYEGGTIMQCTMLPKIDYLTKAQTFKTQQEAVMAKIRQLSKSHIIHPGLPQFQPGAPAKVVVSPKDVPGLRETGWTPEMAATTMNPTSINGDHARMARIIQELVSHPRAWAFLEPVKAEDVPDYYEVIKHPMDFTTIQTKVSKNQYHTFNAFVEDVQLVVDNCRLYNPEHTVYAKNANKIEEVFKDLLAGRSRNDK